MPESTDTVRARKRPDESATQTTAPAIASPDALSRSTPRTRCADAAALTANIATRTAAVVTPTPLPPLVSRPACHALGQQSQRNSQRHVQCRHQHGEHDRPGRIRTRRPPQIDGERRDGSNAAEYEPEAPGGVLPGLQVSVVLAPLRHARTVRAASTGLEPDVLEHFDRLRVRLPVDDDLGEVGPGARRFGAAAESAPTTATSTAAARVWRASLAAESAATASTALRREQRRHEGPLHAVDPRRLRSLARAERASERVGDRHLHVIGRRLEVIADRRTARRVLSDEHLLPADVRAVGEIGDPRDGWPRREDVDVLRLDFGRELLERRNVVGDPDAPSVRGDDDVALRGVDEDVVGPHG